jgi:DNA helicase HerA-like ATPase
VAECAVYGYLRPHPTKRPIVSLMKQARAFGVGVVVATQNPMDLDYRALSNAGLWCIGRLQTDADRARVMRGPLTRNELRAVRQWQEQRQGGVAAPSADTNAAQ